MADKTVNVSFDEPFVIEPDTQYIFPNFTMRLLSIWQEQLPPEAHPDSDYELKTAWDIQITQGEITKVFRFPRIRYLKQSSATGGSVKDVCDLEFNNILYWFREWVSDDRKSIITEIVKRREKLNPVQELTALFNYLVSYEIFPQIPADQFEKLVINYPQADYGRFFDKSRKFNPQIISELFSVLVYEAKLCKEDQCRVLDLQDWRLAIGEQDEVETENYYQQVLGFNDYVVVNLPDGNSHNKVLAKSGNDQVVVEYQGLDTSKGLPASYGINTINALADKTQPPRRYVEIDDDGGDSLTYVALPPQKQAEFLIGLSQWVSLPTKRQEKITASRLNIQ